MGWFLVRLDYLPWSDLWINSRQQLFVLIQNTVEMKKEKNTQKYKCTNLKDSGLFDMNKHLYISQFNKKCLITCIKNYINHRLPTISIDVTLTYKTMKKSMWLTLCSSLVIYTHKNISVITKNKHIMLTSYIAYKRLFFWDNKGEKYTKSTTLLTLLVAVRIIASKLQFWRLKNRSALSMSKMQRI